jgi:outer membrane protein assembly factor BamA
LHKGYEMIKQFDARERCREGALEKRKRRSVSLITLLALACTLCLIPLETLALIKNEYLGDITVTVAGATRTKERFVESLAEKCLKKGDYRSWETVDAEALSQCISNSRLFRSVDVAVGAAELKVTVDERWTLIPVPYVYSSNDKRAAGLFLFESNLLGYGKTVAAGGSVATEGNSFSLMYSDPAVNFSDHTLSIMAFRSNAELDSYVKKNIHDGFNKSETGVFLSTGYRVTPSLELSLSLGYADRSYTQLDSFATPEDYYATSVGGRISYHNADYKLFYNDGLSGSIAWLSQVHRSDGKENLSQATISIQRDIPLFSSHALQLGLHGVIQSDNGNRGDVAMYGRTKGYRGIEPNGLWTRRIAAVSADYQIPVAKTGQGTFTVAPFVDYGEYKPFVEGSGSNYMAYGIGAYYFINLVNLPGIGLVLGRNEQFMGNFVTFQIGMAFK